MVHEKIKVHNENKQRIRELAYCILQEMLYS